jgi:hypothetical protein
MIRLSTPTLTAVTYDLELGLILADFRKPIIQNVSTRLRLFGIGEVMVRARFDLIDGEPAFDAVTIVSTVNAERKHSIEEITTRLEAEGLSWKHIETKLLASYAKGLES